MRVNKMKDAILFIADNQIWTDEDVKELREKYNIFFNKKGVFAVGVKPRKDEKATLIQVGIEDDGNLLMYNDFTTQLTFDSNWLDNLRDLLDMAATYVNTTNNNKKG